MDVGEAVENLTDPAEIARTAEGIYAEKYQKQFEKEHKGEFVAIDVLDGEAYLGQFAEKALLAARENAPHGVFHLIRVGAPGAFRVSYVGSTDSANWRWAL